MRRGVPLTQAECDLAREGQRATHAARRRLLLAHLDEYKSYVHEERKVRGLEEKTTTELLELARMTAIRGKPRRLSWGRR